MSTSPTAALLRHLRQWAAGGGDAPHSDRELLRRFATEHEEAAFATLVRRHGPMVLSVCRRLLPHAPDAEDAFQATFLVLLRRAGTHSWHESIGGWLHGVATRIALRQRADAARRAAAVPRAEESCVADPLEQVTARELLAAFDEELARLPERYRAPLVLCCLQGKTQEETARLLDCSLSTIRRRLDQGRRLLHTRLTRRGLELSAALGAVLLSREAPAVVPPLLRASVLELIHGSVSGRVAVLAEGVLQAAVLTPMKATTAAVLLLGVVAAGAGLAAPHFLALQPPQTETAANAPPEKPTTGRMERADLYGDPLPPGALLRMGTIRFRNRDGIGQIVYSPDGKLLAAGGYGGNIFLYDAATGRTLCHLQAFTHQFPALAFAPDGKTLASADSRTVQIWDVATGKELHRIGVKSDKHFDYDFLITVPLLFSHDGKALAWVAGDHSIHVWDAQTGKERIKLSGHQKPIRCLAFSSDDKTLFSVSYDRRTRDGSVRVWQVAAGKETRKFSLPRLEVPLCFSPDSKTLVFSVHEVLPPKKGAKVLERSYRLAFLDLETGKTSSNIVAQPGQVKTAIFSPDGKSIAAMREVPRTAGKPRLEHTIRAQIWDAATGKQLVDFPAYAADSLDQCHLAFSPDGKKLAAAATASALHVWDVARGREDPEMTQTHHDRTCCAVFSPDGRTLASGSADHTIALWDAVTGKQRLCLRGHEGEVASVAFSPDGKLLASVARLGDQTVRLWDLSTGKELRQFSVPWESMGNGMTRSVNTWIAFTANGKILAAGGTDRKVRLWEAATGKELLNQEVRGLPARSKQGANNWKEDVRYVAFSPDARLIAFSIGPTVHVADVAVGQRLFSFEKDRDTIPQISLSPDGKTMAYVGLGYFFRLVEIASGKDLHKIELPKNVGVLAMTFAPDGRTIAVAFDRNLGRISLFDVPTGKQRLCLQGAASGVNGLAFSPDENKLASAQRDSSALVWDVSSARRKLPRRDLAAKDLERLWADLKDTDAQKAHSALWTLVAAPEKAVLFLKDHLQPVQRVAAERLHRLIADLDADDFTRREEASRELAKLGSEAEAALRKALEGKPSLELRRRVEALLSEMKCQTEMRPDALRQLRAIQVLEQIGSPQARQILASLAQGASAAPATRDAAAALQRLDRRASSP